MRNYVYDDIQRALNRTLEEQRDFLRLAMQAADPLRQFREAMNQTRDRATQFQLSQTALLDKALLSLSAAAESSRGRDVFNLARSLEDEFRGKNLQLAAFEGLHRPAIDAALASVLRHQQELAELTATFKQRFQPIIAPTQQIRSALATLEASARLYSAPAAHWSNALSVVASYQRFAIRQAQKLDSDSAVVGERRARVTELAGGLLVSSLGVTEAMGSEPNSFAPAIEPVKSRIFGPLNSHLGYVYRVTVEVDVDLAVAGALPAKICHLGSAIVATVVRINETLRRRGGDYLFYPTNRSLWAASVISSVVIGAERDFADVVDALFFLLYEGSGASSSRLASILSQEDLQPLWRLKHLRLHYRHEIEHGDSKEIAKKHQKVGTAFIAIAGKHLSDPQASTFRPVQRNGLWRKPNSTSNSLAC